MNRDDFEILKNNDLIYFDNGSTTLKPKSVVKEIVSYYTEYTANAHRGDYDNSLKVDKMYEAVRTKVKNLINCESEKEVVFTSSTTDALNKIVFGFMKYNLKRGDEVLLSKAEHATNILPWVVLAKEIGIVVKYVELDNFLVTTENVKKAITDKTKVISLAQITNVLGDERPIKEIGQICLEKGIYLVVDGAQSVPHIKVDVKDLNIDFLTFSAHKMLGPTGVGVLYGKKELLEKVIPLTYGGGMNSHFDSIGHIEYKSLPSRLEAGTQNISGVIGLGAAIDYLLALDFDQIRKHEADLKQYCIAKMKEIENVEIYNEHINGGTIAFNLKDIFSQDTAIYLNHYKICVRAGNHCAKILKEEIGVANTCRISFYIYNTYEEIDKLIEVLNMSDNIFKVVI